uniref:HEAT repeat-containing protein 1 n=1 Tax=Angiostrongylus cantonensis TaxID=6313 RepID=A0A158P651_ANGCA
MITKEENSVLNEKIDRFLFQLSPYMQHFACHQVLEWLVYRYQIYAYNAEAMIVTFLPFHETNVFGRMLSIIDYNFSTSKDWGFLEGFRKKEYPVPFSAILKNTMSSTHSLITRISDHLNKGIQLVGEEFLEKKCHMMFTFYAKLLIAALDDSTKINDVLLAKIIPLVAVGLKSSLPSFRQVSLMVVCKIAVSTKLTPDVSASFAKILIMKFRKGSLETTLSTLCVVCQQQTLSSFSTKAVLKTLHTTNELTVWSTLKGLNSKTDLTPVLNPLWTTLFSIANQEAYMADHKECLHVLQETSDPQLLLGSQALIFFSKLFEYPRLEKKTALERAEELASSSEFSRRQKFVGDPIKNARKWIKMEMWDNVSSANNFGPTWSYFNIKVAWAFDEMSTRSSYFAQKLEDEVETFVVEVIQMTIGSKKCPVISQARSAFAEVNFRPDFIVALLSNHEECESLPKKPRFVNVPDLVAKMLNNRVSPIVDARIFRILFEILKESCAGKDTLAMQAVGLLLKMLKSPGKYGVTCADLNMDVVLEMMRTTHNHHILRESLRLLTAAVKLSPANVTSHVMSIFTFMGSGLLRKDNELTLGIIEDTVEALFGAICAQDGRTLPSEMQLRLVDVSRVFATSVCDIPAHRRARMANAITRAVKHISRIEFSFCARWQRAAADASKRSADQDAFEDLALELCAGLDPVHQFCVVADIVDFIVRLRGDSSPLESQGRPLDQAVFDSLAGNVECFHFSFKESLSRSLLISEVLVVLDEFVTNEHDIAEKAEEHQTLRYWVALSGRAESVSEKLRHLFPGGVAARIIIDVLEDSRTEWRMREKALQLANSKLIHDGFFFSESGINEEHLEKMILVLNKWITKERLDHEKVVLCQNAAFTLKLVAKRLDRRSDSSILADTMTKCANIAADYQTLDEFMVGNILLLAGELVRSHNMKATMMSAIPLLKTCLSIVAEFNLNQKDAQESLNLSEDASTKQRRVRQQSLSGKKLGCSTLLICALTCIQRIMDQFAPFVSQFLPDIIVQFCCISGRMDIFVFCHPSVFVIQIQLFVTESILFAQHFLRSVYVQYTKVAVLQKPLMNLFSLLESYFNQKNRVIVSQIRDTLMTEVFLKGFEYRARERNVEKFQNVIFVENSMFKALLAMAEVLTENTLRSVMALFVDWAELGLKSATTDHRCRLVTLFRFANSFYNSFNSLALPYFGKLVSIANKVLYKCNATVLNDPSLLLLSGKKGTMDGLEADLLVTNVIDFIANCAHHREFLSQERTEVLIESLVNEILNTKLNGHKKRCVRHRALLVLGAMFDKLGDGVAPYLPMIMPFLSELLEDENENVEEECERVVKLLQGKFGENICEGFL